VAGLSLADLDGGGDCHRGYAKHCTCGAASECSQSGRDAEKGRQQGQDVPR